MSNKPTLHWASHLVDSQGNAYGYYVHDSMLKKHAEKYITLTKDSPNAIFLMSPEFFKEPIGGKFNLLFTMFEGNTIPDQYLKPMQKADHLLAPSEFVADLFKGYFDEDMVSVINHGVSPDFKYKKRSWPVGRPFRFLWVGAHNPRKGWEEVINVWKELGFDKDPRVQLCVKTTTSNKVETKGNVIFDSRNVKKQTLIRLYHESDCFLFPTRGEGFGLTLAEAMATGLPCISTDYSGVKDFFDDSVGYTIGYQLGPGVMTFVGTNEKADTEIAFPNLDELAKQMFAIYNNYEEALKRGEKASKRIKSKFTWNRSALKLKKIIQEHGIC